MSKTMKTNAILFLMAMAVIPTAALAADRLLPFQGHLTSADGNAVEDGIKIIQFKLYDAPVSGEALWPGEVHKLSVNEGLVNTILGTKTSLNDVDFSRTLYLEITVDADGDDQITAADPPLLPRQIVLPALFAAEADNANTMNGHDWSAVFDVNDPQTGKINGSKIADDSIHSDKFGTIDELDVAGDIFAANIFAGTRVEDGQDASESRSISVANEGSNPEANAKVELSVQGPNAGDPFVSFGVGGPTRVWGLGVDNSEGQQFVIKTKEGASGMVHAADGETVASFDAGGDVTFPGVVSVGGGLRLPPPILAENAPAGGVARSEPVIEWSLSMSGSYFPVEELKVTLETTGRPVFVGFQSTDSPVGSMVFIWDGGFHFIRFLEDGEVRSVMKGPGWNNSTVHASAYSQIMLPTPGTHTYTVEVMINGGGLKIENMRLIAFEF
jgi:hypothetical protein